MISVSARNSIRWEYVPATRATISIILVWTFVTALSVFSPLTERRFFVDCIPANMIKLVDIVEDLVNEDSDDNCIGSFLIEISGSCNEEGN